MDCELCRLIWKQVAGYYKSGNDATNEQLQTEYGGPIYLGAGVLNGKFEAVIHSELQPSTEGRLIFSDGLPRSLCCQMYWVLIVCSPSTIANRK